MKSTACKAISAVLIVTAVGVWHITGRADEVPAAVVVRPAEWAVPLTCDGLPNLHQLTPGLYRSAQPTGEGMQAARQMGVKTVVNLRSFHSDRDEIGQTGLAYEHIYMKAWHAEEKEIIRFLQIVTDPDQMPVLVHCQHGADRTGTMCAIYRIVVQGWSKDAAIQEMTEGGYGYHTVWQNLIKFIRELDTDAIREKAGLEPRQKGRNNG